MTRFGSAGSFVDIFIEGLFVDISIHSGNLIVINLLVCLLLGGPPFFFLFHCEFIPDRRLQDQLSCYNEGIRNLMGKGTDSLCIICEILVPWANRQVQHWEPQLPKALVPQRYTDK